MDCCGRLILFLLIILWIFISKLWSKFGFRICILEIVSLLGSNLFSSFSFSLFWDMAFMWWVYYISVRVSIFFAFAYFVRLDMHTEPVWEIFSSSYCFHLLLCFSRSNLLFFWRFGCRKLLNWPQPYDRWLSHVCMHTSVGVILLFVYSVEISGIKMSLFI